MFVDWRPTHTTLGLQGATILQASSPPSHLDLLPFQQIEGALVGTGDACPLPLVWCLLTLNTVHLFAR